MSLWGNSDNLSSPGQVWLDYSTGIVTATSAGTFGQAGAAKTGDIIRFGVRGSGGTYFGDAVIIGITSARQLTIGSTSNLSGAAIANTDFYVSELPIDTVFDSRYKRTTSSSSPTQDTIVYGIGGGMADNTNVPSQYRGVAHAGWVGVTTYNDNQGNLRVKTEVLVAASGISTGANGIAYRTNRT